MPFQVGIGSLGGTVFFLVGLCTPLQTMVWFLRYVVQRTEFFVILDHFLPFYLPNTSKYKIFIKKKTPGDIIILQ